MSYFIILFFSKVEWVPILMDKTISENSNSVNSLKFLTSIILALFGVVTKLLILVVTLSEFVIEALPVAHVKIVAIAKMI